MTSLESAKRKSIFFWGFGFSALPRLLSRPQEGGERSAMRNAGELCDSDFFGDGYNLLKSKEISFLCFRSNKLKSLIRICLNNTTVRKENERQLNKLD